MILGNSRAKQERLDEMAGVSALSISQSSWGSWILGSEQKGLYWRQFARLHLVEHSSGLCFQISQFNKEHLVLVYNTQGDKLACLTVYSYNNQESKLGNYL